MIYAIAGLTVTQHENGASTPEDAIIVASVDDLGQLKMKQLVDLYNILSPLRKVKRFSSKERAQEQVWEVLPRLADHTRGETLAELYAAQFAGRKLHLKVKENPWQPHTQANVAWEKLKDGMTFEQYLRAGGRIHNLLVDIRLERLELR